MNSSGQNDVSPEAMQARIQQARREAENLKDRIKRKKDELADTTRELIAPCCQASIITLLGWVAGAPAMRRLEPTTFADMQPPVSPPPLAPCRPQLRC